MKKILTVALLMLAIGMVGCAKAEDTSPTEKIARETIEGSWKLSNQFSVDGLPYPENAVVTLTVDKDGTISGQGLVNSYGGRIARSGNRIEIDEINSTLMATDNQKIMDFEAAYLKALGNAESYSLDGILVLKDSNGNPLLVFEATEASK